jgi:hypothetical protein
MDEKTPLATEHEEAITRLAQAARDQGLVLFLGAGASMLPPSSLPNWYQFNHLVLAALTRRVAEYTGRDVFAGEVLAALLERRPSWPAPAGQRDTTQFLAPDYQAQLIAEESGEDYFRVLQALDTDDVNAVHQGAAALAGAGYVAAIVTTNFDRLIERALSEAGVAFDVFFDVEGFARLAQSLDEGVPQGGMGIPPPLPVVKVHGSVEAPESMVDTLQQRLAGRPEALERALLMLLERHHWLFLGFSGADFDYDPNYLGLRGAAEAAAGFSFLARPGSPPRPAVLDLARDYGPKAFLVEGKLPGWLAELISALGPSPPAIPKPAVDRLTGLQARIAAWVDSLGDMAAINILTALLQSSGQEDAAFQLLRRTWSFYRQPKDTSGPSYARYNYNYGKALLEAGSLYNPVTLEEDPAAWKHYADRNAFEFLARAAGEGNLPEASIDLAVVQALRGESKEADQGFRRVWAWANEAGSLRTIADAAIAAGTIYDVLGDYTGALECLELGYDLTEMFGDEPRRARLCAYLGRFLGYQRRFEEAEGRLAEGEGIAARLDLASTAAALQAARGSLLLDRNEPEAAMPDLLVAANWLAATERLPALVRVLLDMALAAFHAGYDSELEQALDNLDRLAVEVVIGYRPHYYLTYADITIRRGDADMARQLLDLARQNGELMGNEWVFLKADQLEDSMV